jgi:cation:H+ antiporter
VNELLSSPVVVAVLPWVLLAVGGTLLWWGGDKLVEHSAYLARSFRVPKHVVGAVVLGFGTSLPELLVCLTAAAQDEPGIAIGNVVGSNIANVGFILGIAAVIAPTVVEQKIKRLDLPVALLVAIALAAYLFPNGGELGRVAGMALLAVFAAYLTISLWAARSHRRKTRSESIPERSAARDAFWILVGLALVAGGAVAFVEGATGAATQLGVPSEVIGLSAVAFGTSLPELVTTVQSARQGHPELAVGNVAGSNVFNLLLVLGATSAVSPIDVSPEMVISVIAMVGFSVLAFPIFGRFVRIPRGQGGLLILLYVGYQVWLFTEGRTPS